MLERYADRIFAELSSLLPEKWNRVVLFGLILDGAYEISFYVKSSNTSKYQDDYTLQTQKLFTEQTLDSAVRNIWKLCCEAQNQVEGEKWKSFTLTVEHTGHFSIDYGYEEEIVDKWDEWREKYLV